MHLRAGSSRRGILQHAVCTICCRAGTGTSTDYGSPMCEYLSSLCLNLVSSASLSCSWVSSASSSRARRSATSTSRLHGWQATAYVHHLQNRGYRPSMNYFSSLSLSLPAMQTNLTPTKTHTSVSAEPMCSWPICHGTVSSVLRARCISYRQGKQLHHTEGCAANNVLATQAATCACV